MSTIEIRHLLPLLDDENEEVYGAVKKRILESGPLSIPDLENALDSALTLLQHDRIGELIFQLKMQQIKDEFSRWILTDNKSLQEGWILLSSIQGNQISAVNIENLILQITRKVWLEINQNQTSFEKIAHFNRIFFELNGFRINHMDAPAIEDYFFDKVVILKHGNILSLHILYAIIARKLDLPLIPVIINKKILLAYYDPILTREAFTDIPHPFLFFIDLEHKGKIIGVKEFEYLMKENSLDWDPGLILTNTELIKRLLIKIKGVYLLLRDKEKFILAEDLLNCLNLPIKD